MSTILSGVVASLRCSALPEAFRCPGSVRLPLLRIEEDNDASAVGTAVHKLMERVVDGTRNLSQMPIGEVCERYGVSGDDVVPLLVAGINVWDQIKDSFTGAVTEVPLSATVHGVQLTGHLDALAVGNEIARALDWKTGRVDRDYSKQVQGYLALILLDDPAIREATATVVWLRDRDVETYTMTRDGLGPWLESLRATVIDWNGAYHPGRHCGFCPRSHECPALAAQARRDIAVLSAEATVAHVENGLRDMQPAHIRDLWERWKMVKAFGESFERAMRLALDTGGAIEAEGWRIELETQEHRELDLLKAWPSIQSRLDDEAVAECVSVSITKLDGIVAKRAGKGKGAAAKRALNEELLAAGAIAMKPVKKIKERRS